MKLVWLARMIFGDEALIDLAVRLGITVLCAVLMLLMTVAWAIGIMGQPGGMWWLAAQAPSARSMPMPAPISSSAAAPAPAPVLEPVPVVAPIVAPGTWRDGPPYNQYDRGNYRSAAVYAEWHSAACSAASLAWMMRAYGRPVGALDDAIALIGPGISSAVGLRDHRGTALAATLAGQGFPAWNLHLNSTGDLVAALQRGPVMMDGQRWFGVGHWFVAIGSDAGGIQVRESSGHDVRYLSWQQLYGPVGWSGWAVGIGATAPPNQARSFDAPA